MKNFLNNRRVVYKDTFDTGSYRALESERTYQKETRCKSNIYDNIAANKVCGLNIDSF